jgi:hypothetical protein
MKRKETTCIRRYTSLPQLIHLLRTKTLTLVDPANWDDKNDASLIENYKDVSQMSSVLALCFTESSETYHHWKIYAEGMSGVCVEFYKDAFIDAIKGRSGIRVGSVKYLRIDQLRSYLKTPRKWPFLKRIPYYGEEEFRVIYEERRKEPRKAYSLPFPIKAIRAVHLSPWLYPDLAERLKETINYLPNCSEISVLKTTLVRSKTWQAVLTI